MRQARVLGPVGIPTIYFVTSRVVDKRKVFGVPEKRCFEDLLCRCAQFAGVQLISWVVMGNHFHLQVRIDAPVDPEQIEEGEVVRRVGTLYGERKMGQLRKILARSRERKSIDLVLLPYRRRMGDLSEFVKTLKQRYTQWHNKRKGRKGVLWESRFHSVVVEDPEGWGRVCDPSTHEARTTVQPLEHHPARVVARYVDRNPVRAGLVADPRDYRWSGFGVAVRGYESGLHGLRWLWGLGSPESVKEHERFLNSAASDARSAKTRRSDGKEEYGRCFRGRAAGPHARDPQLGAELNRVKVVGSPGFVEAVAGARCGLRVLIWFQDGSWQQGRAGM